MPPPRLSRHLRPCHPFGSAHQARCASRTSRNAPAAGGHEGKPEPNAQQQQGAGAGAGAGAEPSDRAAPPPADKGSWWTSLYRRFTALGAGIAAPSASSPPSPPSHPPNTSSPEPSADTAGKQPASAPHAGPVDTAEMDMAKQKAARGGSDSPHTEAAAERLRPTNDASSRAPHSQEPQDGLATSGKTMYRPPNRSRPTPVPITDQEVRAMHRQKSAPTRTEEHPAVQSQLLQPKSRVNTSQGTGQRVGNAPSSNRSRPPKTAATVHKTYEDKHHRPAVRLSSQTETLGNQNSLPRSSTPNRGVGRRSLLEELFPEATSSLLPRARVDKTPYQYPKLELPKLRRPGRSVATKGSLSKIEKLQRKKAELMDVYQKTAEDITVLQLAHCSTELTEVDFLRLIPKGKHIEGWRRGGEFFKIIPGRDPVSLERMPFYYLLFNDTEAALAYQKNAARLHKLSALYQPTSILSAVPALKGFLEDGEDLHSATLSYNLAPTQEPLHMTTVMQPYNPALRSLFDRGGYTPIVPNVDEQGQRIWKVLMRIEGYEPTPLDLFNIFKMYAFYSGMQLPLRTESITSIHRLRDIINLKTTTKPTSSIGPRAYGTAAHNNARTKLNVTYEDPGIQSFMVDDNSSDTTVAELNQYVMNRVYNRWVIDFDNEAAARRFAFDWHRRILPTLKRASAWEDSEEARICNTEVLW
ncbi:hypothetical protein T440DRAFT_466352 [Plenodomus tracheiphilus IPT5]|uniref:Uncharacterized protein n=1 Tax=Plenodomus tracheiphilus IPT5 TaxID=1408161 RepID=A0A6A7BBG7_9PLEO|nr:hypothetical protein T440DRAFT_466352 [Plenodomus tracheiphilus IPT5]